MDNHLLSLKWSNHRMTFLQMLSTARNKECYSDVTLACDGKFFKVHKIVLSTCSEYFEQMFEETECRHPIIVLKDITSEELECLLSYMYIGEVNVVQEKLSSLINAAECLRIKGLAVSDEPTPIQSNLSREKRIHDHIIIPEAKRKKRRSTECNDFIQQSNSDREESEKIIDSNTKNKNSLKPVDFLGRKANLSSNNGPADFSSKDPNLLSPASNNTDQLTIKGEDPTEPAKAELDAVDELGLDIKLEPVNSDNVYMPNSNAVDDHDDTNHEYDDGQHFMNEFMEQNTSFQRQMVDMEIGEGERQVNSNSEQQRAVCGNVSTLVKLLERPPNWRLTSSEQNDVTTPAANSYALPYNSNEDSNYQAADCLGDMALDCAADEFSNQSYLTPVSQLDLSRVLTETRLYRCPVCDRESRSKVEFVRHYMTHSGEKPFCCSYCSYKATRKYTLIRHIKSLHPDKYFAPDLLA